MSLIHRFELDRGLLIVHCAGTASLQDLAGLIDGMAAQAAAASARRCAMNLLDLDIQLNHGDHLQLGRYAASRLAKLERVASIVPFQYRIGISEQSAQRGGLGLRTFTSLEEGIGWARGD